ncbi:hypothetical protein [Polaromonas sp.]|uniref:hypothetical protein n=1 Tax=Polaromonas sp. TaxID=1869339 RepID=UPI003263AD26
MNNTPYTTPVTIWFELPYFVGVQYKKRHIWTSPSGHNVVATLSLHQDIIKVYEVDYLAEKEQQELRFSAIKAGKRDRSHKVSWLPRFVVKSKYEELSLKSKDRGFGVPTLSALKVQTKAPASGLLPFSFYSDFLVELLNEIVTAYRVAALPAMRYQLHPLSEANLGAAYVFFPGKKGGTKYGFDVRGHGQSIFEHYGASVGVGARFKSAQIQPPTAQESTFSLVWPLLHARRESEALLIAVGVCDSLLRELVFKCAPSEQIAEIVWMAKRSRTEDIFKEILPAFGVPRLDKENPALWTKYKKARAERSTVAHGAVKPKEAKEHAEALASIAAWLCAKLGSPRGLWRLGMNDPDTGIPFSQFPI